MPRRGDLPSRGDINEKTDEHEREMDESLDDAEEALEDVQTVRETIDELEPGGTWDGAEAVKASMDSAEGASVDEFDQESDEVDEAQQETGDHGDDVEGRSDAASSERDKIAGAGDRVRRENARREIERAQQDAKDDIDFLAQENERILKALEESERRQAELEALAHAGRSQ